MTTPYPTVRESTDECIVSTMDEAARSLTEQLGGDVFMLQVGAMDGILFDPVRKYILDYAWRGLLIEPIPEYFAQLEKNYRGQTNIQVSNLAISDSAGFKDIHYIDVEAVERGELPDWCKGISSLAPEKNAMSGRGCSKGDYKKIKAHRKVHRVECQTIPGIIQEYGIQRIDFLQVDAEGMDFAIVRQVPFNDLKPACVSMEYLNLNFSERIELLTLFRKHRYSVRIGTEYCLALSEALADLFR